MHIHYVVLSILCNNVYTSGTTMTGVVQDKEVVENAVRETMRELEQRAPIQMQRLKKDHEKYEKVVRAAREAATEQVTLAKEFADQPSDILARLRKHLPDDRVKMIQESLTHPTYRLEIVKSADGHHVVNVTRGGEEFLPPRDLLAMADIDWASIMQYASIVVEAVLLVLSAIGISVSPSAGTVEKATEEVAQVLKSSSKFEKAVEAFIDAWKSASGAAGKAKAIFYLMKDTYAAGVLWTVIKALCSNMAWYDWLETSAKVTAMLIAALATEGAALIAEIALVVLSAVDFIRKIANISQLKEIKCSMN